MTAYLAGIMQSRCADHPKADQIDGVMRAVLTAMAYPARDARSQCDDSVRFICSEAVSTIASRCGFERKVIMRAQERAAGLGLIECIKATPKAPKHWRLTLVMSLRGTSAPQDDLSLSGTSDVPERDKTCTSEGHNPESSPVAQAEGDDDDSAAAAADASAGAPATAAAPSTAMARHPFVDRLIAALGCSPELAQAKIDDWTRKAKSNPPGYVNSCIENEERKAQETAASSAKGRRPSAGPAKKTGGASAKKGAASKRGGVASGAKATTAKPKRLPAEKRHALAVEAMRNGESVSSVAARLDTQWHVVDRWKREDEQHRERMRQARLRYQANQLRAS